MKTTNLFADFLIDSNAQFYNIDFAENIENGHAFINFFLFPVYTYESDDQLSLLEIEAPVFYYNNEGKLFSKGMAPIHCRKRSGTDNLSAGDFLYNDWTSDAFLYYNSDPYIWCSSRTFGIIKDLSIILTQGQIQYNCSLSLYATGYKKEAYSWKLFHS